MTVTVTPGPTAGEATVCVTFSLREAAGGTLGGPATLNVNFWEDDFCFDDPIGGPAPVGVTTPPGGSITGPFTVCRTFKLTDVGYHIGSEGGIEVYATIKNAPGIVGRTDGASPFPGPTGIESLQSWDGADPGSGSSLQGVETGRCFPSLAPTGNVLNNPQLSSLFGGSSSESGLYQFRSISLHPTLPSLPASMPGYDVYIATILDVGTSSEIVLGTFPTEGTPDGTDQGSNNVDWTNQGRPTQEDFSILSVPSFSLYDSVYIAARDLQGGLPDVHILGGAVPSQPLSAPGMSPWGLLTLAFALGIAGVCALTVRSRPAHPSSTVS